MQRSICLVRQCIGLNARIECEIRPLEEGGSLWVLLCAAGMAGTQPTAIQSQGPFDGDQEACRVLLAMHESLYRQGYEDDPDGQIWRLHLLAEWRRCVTQSSIGSGSAH